MVSTCRSAPAEGGSEISTSPLMVASRHPAAGARTSEMRTAPLTVRALPEPATRSRRTAPLTLRTRKTPSTPSTAMSPALTVRSVRSVFAGTRSSKS